MMRSDKMGNKRIRESLVGSEKMGNKRIRESLVETGTIR
jgi:hypothetical protein